MALERHAKAGRTVARLGVFAALTAGVCGVGAAAAGAAPPLPPPGPPPAPAAVPAPPANPPMAAAQAEPWASIVRCETGGDWHADTGNGHQGGLQLSPQTWGAYGGGQFAPRADAASPEQQVAVGDRVRTAEGWDAWSGCAERLGLQ